MNQSTIEANDEDRCGCERVCALPEEQLAERSREVRAELGPLLRSHQTSPGRVIWRFDDSETMRAKLEELVEFERQCCAGLDFKVDVDPGSGALTLTVSGEGAEIFSPATAPKSELAKQPGTVAGVAKAGVVGLCLSLALCCVLPMVIAGLGGAALVVPFTGLDRPLFIGAGSLLFAAPVWWRIRRREAETCGSGCSLGE